MKKNLLYNVWKQLFLFFLNCATDKGKAPLNWGKGIDKFIRNPHVIIDDSKNYEECEW